MKKVLFLFFICFIFVGCNKKLQNKTDIQNEEIEIDNATIDNIIVPSSTDAVIIEDNEDDTNTDNSIETYNELFLLPYLGTYLPEIYLSGLEKYKSHTKASDEFRDFDEENPNVLFINENEVQGIYNFHEGSGVEILDTSEDSIVVKTYKGKETYKLEDAQYIIIGDTKYKKISDVKKINEEVISNFLTDLLLPHYELKNENSFLKVAGNKIFYNEQIYEYETGLVGTSPVYDSIINKESYESKYIEILDHQIKIYTAYAPDNNYDMGWMINAIYEIENLFEY